MTMEEDLVQVGNNAKESEGNPKIALENFRNRDVQCTIEVE